MRIDDSTLVINTNPQPGSRAVYPLSGSKSDRDDTLLSFEECLKARDQKIGTALSSDDSHIVGMMTGNSLNQWLPTKIDLRSKSRAYVPISEL